MPGRRRDAASDLVLPLDLPVASATARPKRPPARPAADAAMPDLFAPAPQAPAAAPAAVTAAAPLARPAATPPTRLAADEALLQKVDPRGFRPNDGRDAWLYWLTDQETAEQALLEGLPIDASDPVRLADRPAIVRRLAGLAEDGDLAPQSIVVLRLRRIAAGPFLEPDREPACYILSGGASAPNVAS